MRSTLTLPSTRGVSWHVNVNQQCTLLPSAAEETDTYTVTAQSESEAKHKAQAIAAARDYSIKRFNWTRKA
jgi:hypothetical protein